MADKLSERIWQRKKKRNLKKKRKKRVTASVLKQDPKHVKD